VITSYQFSQRFDTVSILATGLSSLFSLLRTLLLLLVAGAALAAVFAVVVAFWVVIAQVCGALSIVTLFAWVTFPRSKGKVAL